MSLSLTTPLFEAGASAGSADPPFGLRDASIFRWLLLLRFLLANTVGAAVVAVAWVTGWIDLLLAADTTHLVLAIVLVFLAGLGMCARRLAATSRELNALAEGRPLPQGRVAEYLRAIEGRDPATRAAFAQLLRIKLQARITPVRHVAGVLVILGLIGTVLGFVIALAGVDPRSASDPSAIAPMISKLTEGMSVALHTTLVGGVLNIWLMLDYRLLESGTTRLYTRAVEYGERHARS